MPSAGNGSNATPNTNIVNPELKHSYVTEDELTTLLAQTSNALRSLIDQNEGEPNSLPATGGYTNEIAASQNIDQLTGTNLTNITVNGVSGLTAADIPADIIAANYLPLTGGTLTGTLNVPMINASSTTLNSLTATDATTTDIDVIGTGYFDGNVGIGAISPLYALDVAGFVNTDQFSGYMQAGSMVLYASSTNDSLQVGVGAGTGFNATSTPLFSTAVGFDALGGGVSYGGNTNCSGAVNNCNSQYNTAVGYDAAGLNTSGGMNTAMGYEALMNNSTSTYSTAFGYNSLLDNVVHANTAFGAGSGCTVKTGSDNVAVGADALCDDEGTTDGSGSYNTAIGTHSEGHLSAGSNNVAVGGGAMKGSSLFELTGYSNTAIGTNALFSIQTTGNGNVALGEGAGFNLTTGGGNTFIGSNVAPNFTTGNFNIVIGNGINLPTNGAANMLDIGNLLYGTNVTTASSTVSAGNVGIGTPSPISRLTVQNPSGGSQTLALTNNDFVQGSVGSDLQFSSGATTGDTYYFIQTYNAGGTSAGNLVLQPTGNLGVGTTSPASTFAVNGNSYVNGSLGLGTNAFTRKLVIGAKTDTFNGLVLNGNNISWFIDNRGSADTPNNRLDFSTGGTDLVTFLASGNVGVGTTSPATKLEVAGDITDDNVLNCATLKTDANGKINCTSSDERLKQDITPLDASSSLSAIELLNPVSFYWRNPTDGTQEQLGFIAQAVEQIFPELVATSAPTALTPDGTLTFNYLGLIAPIVRAIQQLAAEVNGFAQSVTTEVLTAVTGNFQQINANELCVGSTCVTPTQFQAMVAAANQSPSADTNAASSTTSDTPPVIRVNGDNPAIIYLGDTYSDLGATITGPQADLNLDITTYVNDIEMSPVQIDTSAVATDTIDYVVTDAEGNTATSTRTVIIETASDTQEVTATSTGEASSTPQ